MNKKYLINFLSFAINIKCFLIFFFILFSIKIYLYNNKLKNTPKISIYLPIYNKSLYLMKSIGSIQNQSLKEIEIIAINDYSTDNSLEILKKLSENDSRIKIFNNDKNKGLLYSRAMGILNSTGKYIMNFDPDDLFQGEDNLEYLYNITKILNVDVITFAFLLNNKTNLKCFNSNKILKQPELFQSTFDDLKCIFDDVLWNKLVKRKLMLKVYDFFKNKIYSEKWNYGEDTIWSILINKYAKSKFCINKIIYIYKSNNDSLLHLKWSKIELDNKISFIKMFSEILKNNDEKNYIISNLFLSLSELYNQNLLLLKNNNESSIK